jgi:NAD(P)-dependent dehydrogenase (short-subunit alcohol dehydrogenase family)
LAAYNPTEKRVTLAGRMALVTGAARNTGWAIARTLAEQGATICLHDQYSEDVERCAAELTRVHKGQHFGFAADLRKDTEISSLFEAIRARFGKLDILVANAVHQGLGSGSLPETPIALFDEVWAVNVRGHVLCIQHALSLMATGSSVIFIGSNTATRAIRSRAAYIASKGAIQALTRALALDLAPRGVRVNEVAPAYINTERWDRLDPVVMQRRRANLPLGREASGDEVAAAVAFLASDAAAAITGVSLPVSAGIDAQLVPQDCEI